MKFQYPSLFNLFLIVSILAIAGCEADEEFELASTLSANVDGTVFEAVSVSGFTALGNLTINGTDENGSETIGLVVPDDAVVGTYDLGGPGSEYIGQYNPSSTSFMSATTGTITITEHQIDIKVISGSFDFEASGDSEASITDGTFELAY